MFQFMIPKLFILINTFEHIMEAEEKECKNVFFQKQNPIYILCSPTLHFLVEILCDFLYNRKNEVLVLKKKRDELPDC